MKPADSWQPRSRFILGLIPALLWLVGLLAFSLYQTRSLIFHSAWPAVGKALAQALLGLPGFLFQGNPGTLWIFPLAGSAYGLGCIFFRRIWKLNLPAGPATALGLGALSLLAFALASSGLAGPTTVRAMLGLLGAYGLFELAVDLRRSPIRLGSCSRLAAAVGVLVAMIGLLVSMSLLQPTVFYDALTYHLALPRLYLLTGNIAPAPFVTCSYYPLNLEMLYLLGLAAGGVFPAQLVNALVWLLTIWMGRELGQALAGREGGWLAALALALVPTLSQGAILMTNDGATALFALLGLWCLARIGEDSDSRYYWLWGAAMGLAGGTKYTAYLFVILPQGLLLLLGRGRSWRGLTAAGLTALALCLPWWVRNYLAVGNPFFPVLANFLGGGLDPLQARALAADGHAVALSRSLLADLWQVPWQLFSLEPSPLENLEGRGSLIGPLVLAGLPFLGRPRHWPRAMRWVLLFGLAVVGLWFGSFRMVRYMQPGLAAAAVLSGIGLARWRQRLAPQLWGRTLAAGLLLAFALSGAALTLVYGLDQTQGFFCVRQKGGAADYLILRSRDRVIEAGSFPVLNRLNQTLPPEARVLFVGEAAFFYLKRPSLAPYSMNPNPLVHLVQQGLPFPAIARRLREAGFTHVLYRPDELDRLERSYGLNRLSSQDRARLDQFFSSDACRPIEGQEQPRVIVCELVKN